MSKITAINNTAGAEFGAALGNFITGEAKKDGASQHGANVILNLFNTGFDVTPKGAVKPIAVDIKHLASLGAPLLHQKHFDGAPALNDDNLKKAVRAKVSATLGLDGAPKPDKKNGKDEDFRKRTAAYATRLSFFNLCWRNASIFAFISASGIVLEYKHNTETNDGFMQVPVSAWERDGWTCPYNNQPVKEGSEEKVVLNRLLNNSADGVFFMMKMVNNKPTTRDVRPSMSSLIDAWSVDTSGVSRTTLNLPNSIKYLMENVTAASFSKATDEEKNAILKLINHLSGVVSELKKKEESDKEALAPAPVKDRKGNKVA